MHPPRGVRWHREADGSITVSWRWFRPLGLFLSFWSLWTFGILWLQRDAQAPQQLGAAGTVAFVVLGLCVQYLALCLLFHASSVTVGNGEIRSCSGPLPTHWRNRAMASDRVYAVRIDRPADDLQPHGRNLLSYHLKLETDEFEYTRWAGGICNLTAALYINDAVELLLKIPTEPASFE